MPTTCIVVGCGSRSNRDRLSFFAVPAIQKNKFLLHKNELSKKRREMWLAAIKRDDLTESKLKYQAVCSKHFVTGKPASLEDENHPDWVPSQFMGHKSQAVQRDHGDVDREERLEKRRKLQFSNETNSEIDESTSTSVQGEDQSSGTSVQTDLTMDQLDINFEQLSFAAKKIEDLQKKIENSPYGLMDATSNTNKWKYYTGFEYNIVHLVIFKNIEEHISITSTTALSAFNQLILTLIKLRLDSHFKDLAYHFKISPSTASSYFESIIHIIYRRFQSLIYWPERSQLRKNIPACFKEVFHEKTTIIVDCFEIFMEKPPVMITQQQCWSNYKHHNTVKFLIGITPQGLICFISNAWGGRASDKQIVENTNFLNHISPGDIVLADRGFLIKESLAILQAKLMIPAFTKGKDQLHPIDLEETRHLAHVRIHIERVIGVIKNKFHILNGTIPISMLKKNDGGEEHNLLDKILISCCALVNLSTPIISL